MKPLADRFEAQILQENISFPEQWKRLSAMWEHDLNVTYVEVLTDEERTKLFALLTYLAK